MSIGINILSLRSGVAFAPYLAEAFLQFSSYGTSTSKVPRQGGKGLVIRSEGDLILRHEHRQGSLGPEEVKHYAATTKMRSEIYNVLRMQDEVVLASIGPELLLSHPQSEIWLGQEIVAAMVEMFETDLNEVDARIPDWLKLSMGGGRMLLSDQRTGRWVLLGADHLNELRNRLERLGAEPIPPLTQSPPVINLKGIDIHMQSILKLVSTMEDFAEGRDMAFEEITPTYSLKVYRSANGLELSDYENHTVLNAREVRKWIDLLKAETESLNIRQIERGQIRTVFVSSDNGDWILQWGDEVFVAGGAGLQSVEQSADIRGSRSGAIARNIEGFRVIMNQSTGNCVALTELEASAG